MVSMGAPGMKVKRDFAGITMMTILLPTKCVVLVVVVATSGSDYTRWLINVRCLCSVCYEQYCTLRLLWLHILSNLQRV